MTGCQPRRTLAAPACFAARWRDQAACRGADLDLFFPGRGESAEPARQVCARCPVRQPCLEYAITSQIQYGIWGGLSERERRELGASRLRSVRRERDRAVAAAGAAGYTAAAIGRSFGISRTSVTRILHRAVRTPPLRPPSGHGTSGEIEAAGQPVIPREAPQADAQPGREQGARR